MKTTMDLVDIAWSRINSGALGAAISGKIYKYNRPINSREENVVVNAPSVNNLQLQTGFINVNIFVPNLELKLNGVEDHGQPDHVRLKALAILGLADLKDVWANDYNFDVQQQLLLEDPESKAHYVNIRLDFFNINISN